MRENLLSMHQTLLFVEIRIALLTGAIGRKVAAVKHTGRLTLILHMMVFPLRRSPTVTDRQMHTCRRYCLASRDSWPGILKY